MSKDWINHRGAPPTDRSRLDRLPLRPTANATSESDHDRDQTLVEVAIQDQDQDQSPGQGVASAQDAGPQHAPNQRPAVKASSRGLRSRNIVIDGKRTSIRLDAYFLESLNEAAQREHLSVSDLCTHIHERNFDPSMTLTAAILQFVASYFRVSATEEGHRLAGHGRGQPLVGTPFDTAGPNQSPGAGTPGTTGEAVHRGRGRPRRTPKAPVPTGGGNNGRRSSSPVADRSPSADDAIST